MSQVDSLVRRFQNSKADERNQRLIEAPCPLDIICADQHGGSRSHQTHWQRQLDAVVSAPMTVAESILAAHPFASLVGNHHLCPGRRNPRNRSSPSKAEVRRPSLPAAAECDPVRICEPSGLALYLSVVPGLFHQARYLAGFVFWHCAPPVGSQR